MPQPRRYSCVMLPAPMPLMARVSLALAHACRVAGFPGSDRRRGARVLAARSARGKPISKCGVARATAWLCPTFGGSLPPGRLGFVPSSRTRTLKRYGGARPRHRTLPRLRLAKRACAAGGGPRVFYVVCPEAARRPPRRRHPPAPRCRGRDGIFSKLTAYRFR